MRKINGVAIKNFWSWFRLHESEIFKCPESQDLLKEIDEGISNMSDVLGWEIGPYKEKMYLSLSSLFDADLYRQIDSILSGSTSSRDWVFLKGIQRKTWNSIIEMMWEIDEGNISIAIGGWKHVALKDGEKIEVILEADEYRDEFEGEFYEAACVIVANILGENLFHEKISQVLICRNVEDAMKKHLKPIEWLPYAFGLKPT